MVFLTLSQSDGLWNLCTRCLGATVCEAAYCSSPELWPWCWNDASWCAAKARRRRRRARSHDYYSCSRPSPTSRSHPHRVQRVTERRDGSRSELAYFTVCTLENRPTLGYVTIRHEGGAHIVMLIELTDTWHHVSVMISDVCVQRVLEGGTWVKRESRGVHGNLLQKVTICPFCLVPSVSQHPPPDSSTIYYTPPSQRAHTPHTHPHARTHTRAFLQEQQEAASGAQRMNGVQAARTGAAKPPSTMVEKQL